MTWHWLICFSLAIGAPAAEISGQIKLRDSREASVSKDSDFSGVVVWLEPDGIDGARVVPQRAKMIQKNKTFTPHVLPIVQGSVVDFPNLDPIFHSAFSSYSGQIFDVGLYPPGTAQSVRFTRPGVVRVFCNIHPSMSAIIVVLKTPYFSRTGRDGRFTIEAPPGKYQLHVFHERATEQTLAALSRAVQVAPDGLEIPPIVVSEAGYLPVPHRNKYGKPYPPQGDDRTFYPGVKR